MWQDNLNLIIIPIDHKIVRDPFSFHRAFLKKGITTLMKAKLKKSDD